MDRRNINRGFKKLRVWQVEDPVFSGDAVSLYILSCKIFSGFPFEVKKGQSASFIITSEGDSFHIDKLKVKKGAIITSGETKLKKKADITYTDTDQALTSLTVSIPE